MALIQLCKQDLAIWHPSKVKTYLDFSLVPVCT